MLIEVKGSVSLADSAGGLLSHTPYVGRPGKLTDAFPAALAFATLSRCCRAVPAESGF